jgi:hypothetical protein
MAILTWVFLIFMAGSADRVDVFFGLDYAKQVTVYRIAIWVIPLIVLLVTRRICIELQVADQVASVRRQALHSLPTTSKRRV